MYNKLLCLKRKVIVTLLGVSIIMSFFVSVVVESKTTSTRKKLEDATALLEYLLKEEYEQTIEELKRDAINNNYDINTSMESLYEKDSIFLGVDYVELLASYMTIIRNDITIHDISFISFESTKEEMEYIIPYKTYYYEVDENGDIKLGRVRYISKEGKYDIVEKDEDGNYHEVKNKKIKLESKMVPYGNYSLHLITADELIEKYGKYESIDELDALKSSCVKRTEKLHQSGVSVEGLAESIMLNMGTTEYIDDSGKEALLAALGGNQNTYALLSTASSLLGMVPYEWGGKPTKTGYDNSWWTIQNGKQKGLDCSGFVCWAFMTAGYGNFKNLYSTGTILATQEYISKSELQPGDLGLLNHGENTNHVGIYIGNGYFIHCSSSKGTVVINQFPFSVFMRVTDLKDYALTGTDTLNLESIDLSDQDKYLIAQTVSHEAKGEGLNGWIAVTEVILNRLKSEDYPNDVRDVIYAEGQFQYSEDIEFEEPSNNIIAAVQAVCDGKARMLNNNEVLYFRNPPDDINPLDDWGDLQPVIMINNHVFYKRKELDI